MLERNALVEKIKQMRHKIFHPLHNKNITRVNEQYKIIPSMHFINMLEMDITNSLCAPSIIKAERVIYNLFKNDGDDPCFLSMGLRIR